MRLRFLLLLALLSCAGCSILDVLGITNGTLHLPLPRSPRSIPAEYNSMHDDRGLAGLRVELSGAIERTFTAEDFPVAPFSVPGRGRVFVEVSLLFNGGPRASGPIAGGQAQWVLEPDRKWTLRLRRSEYPPAPYIPDHPPDQPPDERTEFCSWPTCREYWGFEIAPRFRNYDEEALWMVLLSDVHCPEGEVCF